MGLNFSTKTGLVLAVVGLLAIFAGISLFLQAPNELLNTDIDCEDNLGNGVIDPDCETEDDFGIGSCFGGLILIGIGIGTLISALVSIVAGGVTSLSVSSPSEIVIQCPHCNSTLEMPSNASGLFDCPDCNEEFQWN
tara:strand:- start:113 stop:523 length:411 start_codon:yes stop_codon:yes gene_type:complete